MKRGCLICDSPLFFLFREMPRHRIELWTRGFSVGMIIQGFQVVSLDSTGYI